MIENKIKVEITTRRREVMSNFYSSEYYQNRNWDIYQNVYFENNNYLNVLWSELFALILCPYTYVYMFTHTSSDMSDIVLFLFSLSIHTTLLFFIEYSYSFSLFFSYVPILTWHLTRKCYMQTVWWSNVIRW